MQNIGKSCSSFCNKNSSQNSESQSLSESRLHSQLTFYSKDKDARISKIKELKSGDKKAAKLKIESRNEDLAKNSKKINNKMKEEKEDGPRKRRKKDKFGDFIIDEAIVDDEVRDNKKWKEGSSAGEIERSRRDTNLANSQKENEIKEYVQEKCADLSPAACHFGEEMNAEIIQQTLLPTKQDKLWSIKCPVGKEMFSMEILMLKCSEKEFSNKIKSIVIPDNVKGIIYVETSEQSYVMSMIENMEHICGIVMLGQEAMPINEMPDVLQVRKQRTHLKVKQWVRVKQGIFKNDIAQIDYVYTEQDQVRLKLLPRIDYTRSYGTLRTIQSEFEALKQRPAAKLFDAETIRAFGGEVASDEDFLIFEGNRYSHKGFLYKNFITSAIITDGVKPTLSELKAFLEVLEDTQVEDLNEIPGSEVFGKENQVTTRSVSNGDAMCCEDKLKNSDKNDLHTHIVNEAVFNSKRESEQEDLKTSQGKNARCVSEFQISHFADVYGIRNQYQHRLSVKEHLIKNSCTSYTVEILDKKQPSAVPTDNSQQALKNDDDEEKKEAPSNEKPIVMRFKRNLRLSLLNDEAGSSMFGKSKWDDSNEYTSNDEQSNVLLRNTDSSEIDNIVNSPILSSSSLDSSPIKQEIVKEDSVHLSRIRKTSTQAEFIKDNTDYYKFQTPDSKLWYQAPLIDVKNIAVDDNKLAMRKSSQEFTEERKLPIETNNDTAQKIHSSNLSAKIEGMKFSFEMIPKFEPWYQTYQRQCMNAEFQHSFSMYDAKKPFLLPYEIENEMLSQRNSHCHTFTAVTHEREEQESLNLCKIEESSLIRSCMNTSKLERKQDPTSDADEELKKITEEMKEIQSMENIEDGIGNVRMNNFDLDLLPKFINEIGEKQSECSKKHTTELENNSLCANLKSDKAKINIRKRKRKINRTGWSLVRKKKKETEDKKKKEKETKEKT